MPKLARALVTSGSITPSVQGAEGLWGLCLVVLARLGTLDPGSEPEGAAPSAWCLGQVLTAMAWSGRALAAVCRHGESICWLSLCLYMGHAHASPVRQPSTAISAIPLLQELPCHPAAAAMQRQAPPPPAPGAGAAAPAACGPALPAWAGSAAVEGAAAAGRAPMPRPRKDPQNTCASAAIRPSAGAAECGAHAVWSACSTLGLILICTAYLMIVQHDAAANFWQPD